MNKPVHSFAILTPVRKDQRLNWHTAMAIKNVSRAFGSVSGTSRNMERCKQEDMTMMQEESGLQQVGELTSSQTPGTAPG